MKKTVIKTMLCLAIASGVFATSVSEAYWCRWRPGFWANGYWHHARRVCWGGWWGPHVYGRCRWVPGHYRAGLWVPGHRFCW